MQHVISYNLSSPAKIVHKEAPEHVQQNYIGNSYIYIYVHCFFVYIYICKSIVILINIYIYSLYTYPCNHVHMLHSTEFALESFTRFACSPIRWIVKQMMFHSYNRVAGYNILSVKF